MIANTREEYLYKAQIASQIEQFDELMEAIAKVATLDPKLTP